MSNLSKLLARSGTLAQQGDLNGARAELEKAVRDHGRRAEPWISLAAIHGMGGNYPEALRCASKAVELAPDSLQGWINLAGAAQSVGNLSLAAEALQRARGLPGCPPRVLLDLGNTLARLDRWAEAERSFGEYLARAPADRDTLLTYAKALARNGKAAAAAGILDDYRRRQPGDIKALVQLGRIHLEARQSEEAWRCCDQALSAQPGDPEALFFKADLLEYDERFQEAVDILEQLVRLLPENPRILGRLSNVYMALGITESAIAYARAALQFAPHDITALLRLSSTVLTRDVAESRSLLERAETIAPHDPAVRARKAYMLEFAGDKQGAWECVKAVIESGSADVQAATVAASVAPAVGKAQEAIDLLEHLVGLSGIPDYDHRQLRFALARLCDKAKQYDRAFGHALVANRLKKTVFDQRLYDIRIERLKSAYVETASAALPRSSNRSDLPVFIVGMPRSGTSLLEQILSCHSQVHARGETNDIKALAESIPYYPDAMRNLPQEKCDALAEAYLERLRAMAPAAARVTDKMPGNYMHLGLISQIFPGARIINCRRDPRDVCLSNFMIQFTTGHEYSYNLESVALACRNYMELMEHWKRVLPIPILDVRYEDVIADPRTWVAKVLDFCGLDWEDACLNFHKSDRQVMTASYDQVRKPLYKTSVARWKHYERHLEPVSRILGLHDDNYP